MPAKTTISEKPKIAYSCYFTRSREGEQFVPEHVFSYQISGVLTMNDGKSNIFLTRAISGSSGVTIWLSF
jgi:hypothetical protein